MQEAGTHIILDFYYQEEFPSVLEKIEYLKPLLVRMAEKLNLEVLEQISKKFDPQGYTGILLLGESHLSIHTWPEKLYIALDIYSCYPIKLPIDFNQWLVENLLTEKLIKRVINRPYINPST